MIWHTPIVIRRSHAAMQPDVHTPPPHLLSDGVSDGRSQHHGSGELGEECNGDSLPVGNCLGSHCCGETVCYIVGTWCARWNLSAREGKSGEKAGRCHISHFSSAHFHTAYRCRMRREKPRKIQKRQAVDTAMRRRRLLPQPCQVEKLLRSFPWVLAKRT
jgi:hypothetical protein